MTSGTQLPDRRAGAAADPVVVSGLGVLAPNGSGVDAYWDAVLAGVSGIRPLTGNGPAYSLRVAGTIPDFDAEKSLPSRLRAQTDRWTHLALESTAAALDDSGADLSTYDDYELAVVSASASGGNEFGQREDQSLWGSGPGHVGAYQSIAWFYAACTGQISIRHGMRGPCGVVVSEQAGGLDAVAQARRGLRTDARLAVVTGTEAGLSPYALVCQMSLGSISTSADPATAFLPFDRRAAGHVPGEGGATLVLERLSAVRSRAAGHVYGEIAGLASTFDPRPGSGREPALRRCAELALADAGLLPSDVDVVFADAAGQPQRDGEEAAAISAVFGRRGVPVTAPKTMTGRLSAGGAALDLATAFLALERGTIPPTTGVTEPDERLGLDLVTAARPAPLRSALVLARGYGGFNSAAVLRSAD